MEKKILVSDYDRTLYLNDDDMAKNKDALIRFKNQGNIVMIATGRSYYDFKKKLEQYDFKYDYVSINHGATILDKAGHIFCDFKINNSVIQDIKKDLELEKADKWFCCSGLESRTDFEHKDISKVYIKYLSEDQAKRINDLINTKYCAFVNSYHISKYSIEIVSNKIDKSKAIKLLLNELNIPTNNVFTIGDGYSDINMVRDFNGYAMRDSVEELKKVAKKEVNSVSEVIDEIINK